MTTDHGPTVDATRTSLEVVEALRELDGAGVTAVARHLDIPKSTAHKHLRTLVSLGYVSADDGTYDLDVPFVSLGQYARERDALLQAAQPEVDRLASMTKETAGLYVARGGRGFDVYRTSGANEGVSGLPRHLHCTAPGKAILAELPEREVASIVDEYGLPAATEHTLTDRDELADHLERVRDRGIAFDREEHRLGVRGVAIPVTTGGDVVGALYVVGDAERLTGKWFDENTPGIIVSAVNTVEQNLQSA